MMTDATPLHSIPLVGQHCSNPVFGKVVFKPRIGTIGAECQLMFKVPFNSESDNQKGVAFFVHCRHFSPIICHSAKRGMKTSDCFVWCFEISATPVLPPFLLPFGTIHQTKEWFSMVKFPIRSRLPTTFNWIETTALSGKSNTLRERQCCF